MPNIQVPPDSTGKTVETVTPGADHRQVVAVGGDGAVAEVAGLSQTQPTATEWALITRPIQRVDGEELSVANLGIGGVFTGAWNDANADGVSFVEASAFADEVSAADGFVIEESDDSADGNFTRIVASATVAISTLATIRGIITARYWRVKYTNGGTAQTSFKLDATARMLGNADVTAADSDAETTDTIGQWGNARLYGREPVTNDWDRISASGNTADAVIVRGAGNIAVLGYSFVFNGTTWDRARGTVADGQLVDLGTNNDVTIQANADVNLAQIGGSAVLVGGGVEAGALRVTIANDSTGVITVDASALDIRALTNADVVTVEQATATSLKAEVIGTGTFATQDSEKVVDNAAFTDGTTPVQPAGYVFDDVAGAALTENDAAAARIDSKRAQVLVIEDETTRGRAATVTASNALKIDGSAVTQPVSGTVTADAGTGNFGTNLVQVGGVAVLVGAGNTGAGSQRVTIASDNAPVEVKGNVAHSTAIAGNPVPVAARANANEPTAVADAESTYLWADQLGRLVVLSGHPSPEAPDVTTLSADGSLIAAPGASLSLYIVKGSVHSSAAAEQVAALRDGSAGTIRWQANIAADGGGSLFDFGSRGWKLTANTALFGDAASASLYYNITEYYIAA